MEHTTESSLPTREAKRPKTAASSNIGGKSSAGGSFDVAVIGIGAMGGGMARALLESSVTRQVVGYDVSPDLAQAFYRESEAAGKQPAQMQHPPTSLSEAVTDETDFVVVVLQNEPQCEQVCFGASKENLVELLRPGACVVLCSTVTASWTRVAHSKFAERNIAFVDSPISGGPVRARAGDLTSMASGDDDALVQARPILEVVSNPEQLYVIKGGAGMGSTVKMVHQLLAGVHVVASAEALALAAKAGLDVRQLYEIVNGAAGSSWMFRDRGQRMISEPPRDVKSQLQIFVKDMDIVYSEAKKLKAPVPLACTALQQFIAGQGLGLSRKDDSELVKVYEIVTGVPVGVPVKPKEGDGDQVGDIWVTDDGSSEPIVEVGREPRHHIVLSNEYVRALRVEFPPGDTTLAHKHAQDSLYFFLVSGRTDIINHVKGSDPQCDCVDFGEIRYGAHKTDKPLVHKITNNSKTKSLLCIDAEVLRKPPVTSVTPLMADKHELVKQRDKCRCYKLTLQPGESVVVTYNFFHFTVVLEGGVAIAKELLVEGGGASGGRIQWTETAKCGDVSWKEPVHNMKKTNNGSTTFVEYITEWC